jgi:hypothetical protein
MVRLVTRVVLTIRAEHKRGRKPQEKNLDGKPTEREEDGYTLQTVR